MLVVEGCFGLRNSHAKGIMLFHIWPPENIIPREDQWSSISCNALSNALVLLFNIRGSSRNAPQRGSGVCFGGRGWPNPILPCKTRFKDLVGHGRRMLSADSVFEPGKKCICWSCFSPLFCPLGWARLGDGSTQWNWALLTAGKHP